MIGSFASLGILRWFAMPGGQTFIVGGMVIAGVFAAGYWLRWDARADATRTVITRVVEKHKKENDKLLTEVAERNVELARAVKEAREELTFKQGKEAELEVKLAQAQDEIVKREAKLALALQSVGKDKSHLCGLTTEEIGIANER